MGASRKRHVLGGTRVSAVGLDKASDLAIEVVR